MEWQIIFNILIPVLGGLCMIIYTNMNSKIKDLKADMEKNLDSKCTDLTVRYHELKSDHDKLTAHVFDLSSHLPTNYVSKEELRHMIDKLFEKLDRISEKLDSKQDKKD